MCRVTSTGVLVNKDTTSCEMRISSVSVVRLQSSLASSLEFLQWCSVSPIRGLIISASALDRLYVTEPMLSTMGRRGESFLWIFGVPYIRGMMLAVGMR